MENIQIILSIASAALGLLITTLTFLIKFIRAVKAKNKEAIKNLLIQGATNAVQLVEQVKSKAQGALDGPTKKSMAMNEMKSFCAEHNIKFDESSVSELIEEIVALTKVVNAPKSSETTISGTAIK